MKLINSNKYLKNKKIADKLLKQTILSSEAVEKESREPNKINSKIK
jgi:hypothetical protein